MLKMLLNYIENVKKCDIIQDDITIELNIAPGIMILN